MLASHQHIHVSKNVQEKHGSRCFIHSKSLIHGELLFDGFSAEATSDAKPITSQVELLQGTWPLSRSSFEARTRGGHLPLHYFAAHTYYLLNAP